ncbi:hypothetical protein EDM56_11015 [Brevibacillus fluminis]|uniref:DUF3923 family protein n=1 Tax=Brevibacillus fluminis TaxID=511487 RepID=A0A3M8DQI8_9BACL|nr:hypothetical protein [Brevibacillus fluminis]RNB89701.1 hypothetical protein EDM56_11015 [Brevibacillus fluminis]
MKSFLFVHLLSLVWVLLLIWYLPGSPFLSTKETNMWMFLLVDAIAFVPILCLICLAVWMEKRKTGKQSATTKTAE